MHFTRGSTADVNVTYARSAARADLNALTNYFDKVLWPIVGANAYAPAPADAPNRLLARGRVMPTPRWLLLGIFDWRSGLPYSVVNDTLDFVGPRNSAPLPDLRGSRPASSAASRSSNSSRGSACACGTLWNSFLPTDVQANLGSPAFGTFYNSEYRSFHIQVRFER